MATVVHNPTPEKSEGSGPWMFLAVVALIIGLIAVVWLLLPTLRRTTSQQPSIQVPEQIDVNVNTEGEGQ